MKSRDVVLGLTSGVLYFMYGCASANVLAQVQSVFLLAAVGCTTAIYALVKGKLE